MPYSPFKWRVSKATNGISAIIWRKPHKRQQRVNIYQKLPQWHTSLNHFALLVFFFFFFTFVPLNRQKGGFKLIACSFVPHIYFLYIYEPKSGILQWYWLECLCLCVCASNACVCVCVGLSSQQFFKHNEKSISKRQFHTMFSHPILSHPASLSI